MMRRKTLFDAARLSPWHAIRELPSRTIVIYAKHGVAVVFWDDGSMHRGDVDLDLALLIPTVKEAAKILGLSDEASRE